MRPAQSNRMCRRSLPRSTSTRALLFAALTILSGLLVPSALADRVLLLVDNSGSMHSSDADRLVPQAVNGFIRTLPADMQVGVIGFDVKARLVQPLIPAGQFRDSVLDSLDYTGQLTDPSAAVERGLYEFRQQPVEAGSRDFMVLITDGVVDLGNADASLRAEDWLVGELRRTLQERGIRVWAVALTEAADFRMLSRLTSPTGGQYYRAMDASEVQAAITRIGAGIAAAEPPPVEAPAAVATAVEATARTTTPAPAPTTVREAAAARETITAPEAEAPAPAGTVAIAPAPAADGEGLTGNPRWWLAFALLVSGILMLAWVSYGTWSARRFEKTDGEPALEYFPECYLVDLQGVTDRPTHMLSGKYNMVTRLQNPPADGINYIQVFRRQIGRRHALIEYRDFSFWITDQNSVNGTFLNDERLTKETRLKHGDRIRFHVYEFEFCVSDLALSNETLVDRKRAPA